MAKVLSRRSISFLQMVTVAYNLYVTHSKYINKIKLKYNDAHELETICMRLV